MNITLIGYGKMGKAIEEVAIRRQHNISLKIDREDADAFDSDTFRSSDVAIEFTAPESAYDNIMRSFDAGIPIVSGSTGWLQRLPDVLRRCKAEGRSFFYSANYSIGMNLFMALNRKVAKWTEAYDYRIRMDETHHIHKADAPSGTAIRLAEEIIAERSSLQGWEPTDKDESRSDIIPIQSHRIGEVPGIHQVEYTSTVDRITLTHEAFTREGFALGAVLAAEFIRGKVGAFSMEDLIRL